MLIGSHLALELVCWVLILGKFMKSVLTTLRYNNNIRHFSLTISTSLLCFLFEIKYPCSTRGMLLKLILNVFRNMHPTFSSPISLTLSSFVIDSLFRSVVCTALRVNMEIWISLVMEVSLISRGVFSFLSSVLMMYFTNCTSAMEFFSNRIKVTSQWPVVKPPSSLKRNHEEISSANGCQDSANFAGQM